MGIQGKLFSKYQLWLFLWEFFMLINTYCPLDVWTSRVINVEVAGHIQFRASIAYLNSSSHTTWSVGEKKRIQIVLQKYFQMNRIVTSFSKKMVKIDQSKVGPRSSLSAWTLEISCVWFSPSMLSNMDGYCFKSISQLNAPQCLLLAWKGNRNYFLM